MKNEVISRLLVYLVVLVGAHIRGISSWIDFNTPSYDLKREYHVKMSVPVLQGECVQLNKPILA